VSRKSPKNGTGRAVRPVFQSIRASSGPRPGRCCHLPASLPVQQRLRTTFRRFAVASAKPTKTSPSAPEERELEGLSARREVRQGALARSARVETAELSRSGGKATGKGTREGPWVVTPVAPAEYQGRELMSRLTAHVRCGARRRFCRVFRRSSPRAISASESACFVSRRNGAQARGRRSRRCLGAGCRLASRQASGARWLSGSVADLISGD